jgi:L-methionine (R)-S-oxide reductase
MNEQELTKELERATRSPGGRRERAARVASAIRAFGRYRWVGVYEVTDDEIAVVAWEGPAPPTHPRFPREQGLCGAAVAAGETVVVGDVAGDPRYLTTHSTTRSEIVVPVLRNGVVVGLIDVESELPDAFGEADVQLLERCGLTDNAQRGPDCGASRSRSGQNPSRRRTERRGACSATGPLEDLS